MTSVGRKHGRGADDVIAECRAELLELGGPACVTRREADITALPTVVWKGCTLYTLRCNGISGKGPHAVNVPLIMCWALVDLQRYYCPYHVGDAWSRNLER